MAAVDRANAKWDVLQTVADANKVDPAMFAAVGIEESSSGVVQQLLQAMAAAYNIGTDPKEGHKRQSKHDAHATGNNHGSSVVNLMDCF